jgi:hypothetical protein
VDKLVARSVSHSRVSHKGKSPSPPKFFDVQRPAEPKCNLNLSRCTSHDYFKWHSVRMAQLQSYLYFHCYHVTGSTVHDFVAAICLRTLRSWNKFMGSVRSAEGNKPGLFRKLGLTRFRRPFAEEPRCRKGPFREE